MTQRPCGTDKEAPPLCGRALCATLCCVSLCGLGGAAEEGERGFIAPRVSQCPVRQASCLERAVGRKILVSGRCRVCHVSVLGLREAGSGHMGVLSRGPNASGPWPAASLFPSCRVFIPSSREGDSEGVKAGRTVSRVVVLHSQVVKGDKPELAPRERFMRSREGSRWLPPNLRRTWARPWQSCLPTGLACSLLLCSVSLFPWLTNAFPHYASEVPPVHRRPGPDGLSRYHMAEQPLTSLWIGCLEPVMGSQAWRPPSE